MNLKSPPRDSRFVRATLLALLLLAATLAGCASPPDSRASLVAYPKLGDVVTYTASGTYLELARWENGHPITSTGEIKFEVAPGESALDGARQVHETYRVHTRMEGARHAELFVLPARHAIVQSYYPLSQDQGIVAFDERSFPWLFGASALFGQELVSGAEYSLRLEDNLGAGAHAPALSWRVLGEDNDSVKVELVGSSSIDGALWFERGSAWPVRATITIHDDGLAPQIRVDGAYPATMDARRSTITPGGESLPPRRGGFSFAPDASVSFAPWDGEKPPDGDAASVPYLLSSAVSDAKLLDKGLVDFLAASNDPRLYRATFKQGVLNASPTGPIAEVSAPYWLLQFMNKAESFYEVQLERVDLPVGGRGVPRVLSSGPVDGPKDASHGWFAKTDLPEELVPLSEGMRVVRQLFGADGIQIFLRSFSDPPGYSYFLDGGWEAGESSRYTVVYNPTTGFVEEATGPVTPRLAQ